MAARVSKWRLSLQLKELLNLQRPPCHSSLMNRPFEVIHQVDPNADRRAPFSLRRQLDLSRPLQPAVDIVPELASVVDHRNMMPRIQRVQFFAVDQRLRLPGVRETVETPLPADKPGLQQKSGLGAILLHVEEALFGAAAAVRLENNLPRERLRTCQGMHLNKNRVICTIELDGLTERGVDDARLSQNFRGVAANAIQPVKGPDLLRRRLSGGRCSDNERCSQLHSSTGAVCSAEVTPGRSSMSLMFRKWISDPSDSRHK